ncbi:aldehyde dehydrogenase [Psychroflexus salis]|uniref:Aldehyde dehydrogenase n=1 Tax=Psychroflexus salis TaxID=1526574 RepID=A0A916ZXP4_9FLAO|nr:aldehyde dehydrogenase [Psychroflexus salis]GGE17095.1 aldehyde dehydrogenase [Psychroflexus salis]
MTENVEILVQQKNYLASHETVGVQQRIDLLKKLKSYIENHEQEILDALYADFKKSHFEGYATELLVTYKEINLFIKKLKQWSRPKRVLPTLFNFPSLDYIYQQAWGQVLVIAPWNYPFQLAINPVLAAIACGNSVILKPSELTPHTAKILEQVLHAVFPKEIAYVIQGGAETSTYLLKQKWDYIFFTGSVPVGKIVAKAAAEHLTPVTLELGGKNPCIVDETANLAIAAKRIVWGKLINAGQTCIAPDYILVQKKVKEKLVKLLIQEIESSYTKHIDQSPDYPRIVNPKNFERLAKMLSNEKLLYGGQLIESELYIEPTLIDEPNLDSEAMQDEIFGPILPILSYTDFNEVEHSIQHFPHPLSLFIFSENATRAKQWMQQFEFGGGIINDTIVHFVNDRLPFGGVGNSGMGQYHGKHSFETFTRKKAVLHRKTWIDLPFRYPPYGDKLNLLKRVKSWFT